MKLAISIFILLATLALVGQAREPVKPTMLS